MQLRKSIIDERIDSIAGTLSTTPDLAFLRLVYSLIANASYDEIEVEDIVDGGQDKQLDIVSVEDTSDETATILVLQTKTTPGFSSNALIQMANGLSWLFEKPRSDYEQLTNERLVNKIREVRELRNRLSPSNLTVSAYFVTTGDSSEVSSEFLQELAQARQKYQGEFGKFEFNYLGSSELVDLLNQVEKKERQLDDTLQIIYDVNRPSLIEYEAHGLKGAVCSVPASEIARLIAGDREKSVFDRNLRRFLGARGSVNSDIGRTSSNPDESFFFWFFNNGITIICDRFDLNRDQDSPFIRMTNIQIVNGCQTSVTLSKSAESGLLQDDVYVLVKVFQTSDPAFVDRIVLTTNNQNSIDSRDLKANDPVQIDYQRAFADQFGLYYERKINEFKDLPSAERRKIASNEKVGQAYLAVVRKRLTTARAQRYRIWRSDLYPEVFPQRSVEGHVLAYLIYQYCWDRKSAELAKHGADHIRYSIVSYGVFHLARVIARRFTGAEAWTDPDQVGGWIASVQRDPAQLDGHYDDAVELIAGIIAKHPEMEEQVNNAFKATEIETEINRALNPTPRQRATRQRSRPSH